MIGASGAISGLLGAYLLLFPHARVHVLIPFGILWMQQIRAGWVLGFWFVFQLLSGLTADPTQPGVAFLAHIGGFVAGMVLIFFFRDRRFRVGGGRRASLRGRSRIPPTRSGPWT
jgi:membrane associated rhomboid family serine protease